MKRLKQLLLATALLICIGAQAQKDVTSQYITNATLSNGLTGWTVSNFNAPQQGHNTVGWASEAYAGWDNFSVKSFSMTQNITLPAGHYTLVNYSFFRQGEYQNTNVSKSLAKLKAGDSEVALKTLGSINAGGYANNQSQGADAFDSKMYRNTLDFTIDADNTVIEIGIVGTFDEMRSWCIAGMFELINNDIPATMDTPLDVTGYLINPGFEYRNLIGWQLGCPEELSNNYVFQTQSNNSFGLKAGGYYCEAQQESGTLSDRSITQSLSNLPNGYYKLSANVSYGGSGAYVSLNDKKTAVEANNARRYTVGCVIDDGNLTVGLGLEDGTSNYLAFDGFSLLYCGDVTEALTTLCAQVTNYEGLIPTAVYNQLVSSVNEKNHSYSDIDELLQAISDVQGFYDEIDVLKSPYAAWKALKSQATALVAVPNDNSSANNTFSTVLTTQSEAAEASTAVEGLTTATSTLKAAMREYVFAASPTEGNKFDLTFLIETPDMTSLWDGTWSIKPSGWDTEQTGGNFQVMRNADTDSEDGLHNVFIEYYYLSNGKTYGNDKFNVYTTVNLPVGTYTMSCYAFAKEANYTSGNPCPAVFFYANGTQGSQVNSSIMSEQSISFINDEAQDVKIGLKPLNGNTYNWMGIGYVKLYKEYTDNSEYDITIAPLTKATVITTVDGEPATTAQALKTVTMTFTPDEGYRVESVEVSYDDGTETQYLDVANPSKNVFTFQMPAYNVNVTASTVEDVEPYAVLSENNTILTFYYDNKRNSRDSSMDIDRFGSFNEVSWYSNRSDITTVVFDESFANYTTLTSTAYWFYFCTNLTSIQGISNLKTENVTSMESMFEGCYGLTTLDVSNFNTSKVTDMSWMFGYCYGLTTLDVSNFNTGNVTDMSYMFSDCYGLTALDISNFNTSKATYMYSMFQNCASLTNLDLSNFTIGSNTSTSYMIRECDLLETLTLPASAISFAANTFTGCTSLKYVTSLIEDPTSVTLSESAFDKSVYQTAILFVPDGTLALYQAENGWKKFQKIIDLSTLQTSLSTLCAQVTSYEGFIPTPAYNQLVSSVNAKNHEYNNNDELLQAIEDIYALYDEADLMKNCYAAWKNLKTQATALVAVPNDNSSANSQLSTAITTQDTAAEASATVEELTTAISALKAAMTTYVSAASPTQGNRFDLTFMIETPDLTSLWDGTWSVKPSGWATEQTGGNFQVMQNDDTDSEDGLHNVFIEYYYLKNGITYDNNKFNVYTTVNLPAGTYTMSCYAFAKEQNYESGNPSSAVFFYANGTQGSLVNSSIMSEQSISFINDEAQDVKIGLKPLSGNTYNWMGIGYVKLYKEYAEDTEYAITIGSVNNATVITTVDGEPANAAKALKTVTMTFTPADEYRVSSVTVSYNDGTTTHDLDVANPSVNVYTFQMPAYDVTINAVMEEAETEPYAVLSENNTVLTFYYDKKRINRGGMGVGPFNSSSAVSWYSNRSDITTVVFDDSFANYTNLTSTAYWFYECENLTSILGIGNLDTENVTNMAYMFTSCYVLENIDLNGFDTRKVTDMSYMFFGCSGLTALDVSSFNTEKVNNMDWMFGYCYGLTELDVSNFNTRNVEYMFYGCFDLTLLTLPSTMSGISSETFRYCNNLSTIISSFTTPSSVSVQNDAFDESAYSTATLVVPDGTLSLYQAADGWKRFLNIVEYSTFFTLAGDANGDGVIDVNDITAVVNYIQGNPQPSFDSKAADVNNDGEIDVNDITSIVNIIQQ